MLSKFTKKAVCKNKIQNSYFSCLKAVPQGNIILSQSQKDSA